MRGLTIQEIHIGDHFSISKTITEADVMAYAEVTGDYNPQHLDEAYAKTTIFKGRIAHGMLSVGLISRILGTELPGMGSIYLSQEVHFLAPVYFEDTITANVEVVDIIDNKKVKCHTYCTNQSGVIVIDGFAYVKPPKVSM